MGYCLRHAPRFLPFEPKSADPEADMNFTGYWPKTCAEDSCGEHHRYSDFIAQVKAKGEDSE